MFRDYDGTNLRFHEFAGTAQDMGKAHADHLKDDIAGGIAALSRYFETTEADLDNNASYARWREGEIEYHDKAFPHLIAETHAIAQHAGIAVERLFDLTFNGFSVVRRHCPNKVRHSCSLIAVTTDDGCPALLSTLDDAQETWPAMGRYVSSDPGRRTLVGAIWLGTAGVGRGMNDAGLWVGTASSGLSAAPDGPLANKRQYAMGYLLRAMLESCATVDEARRFLQQYPFCCNILLGDAQGGILGIHQSLNGPYDVTGDGFAAMTNAITDDAIIYQLTSAGMVCKESLASSRPRMGFLRDFIRCNNGACTFEQFVKHVARRDTDNLWSINHNNTVYITLASPKKDPHSMWVCRPADPVYGNDFIRLEL